MAKNDLVKEIKVYTRQCHDCGKRTNNYRCNECLEKWRIKHEVTPNAVEYEPTNTACGYTCKTCLIIIGLLYAAIEQIN